MNDTTTIAAAIATLAFGRVPPVLRIAAGVAFHLNCSSCSGFSDIADVVAIASTAVAFNAGQSQVGTVVRAAFREWNDMVYVPGLAVAIAAMMAPALPAASRGSPVDSTPSRSDWVQRRRLPVMAALSRRYFDTVV